MGEAFITRRGGSGGSSNSIPIFTYTGSYQLVNDNNEIVGLAYKGNWKIRLLTSGVLTFTKLNSAKSGIEVFCVGGGGGTKCSNGATSGAGGGYTATGRSITVTPGVAYNITVGAGGAGTNGGKTEALGVTANGGDASLSANSPGSGGSGGGSYGATSSGGAGGSNGSNGNGPGNAVGTGGKGQGTTTREFGESTGKLYAGGGGGGYFNTGSGGAGGSGGGAACGASAAANTGGGAGGFRHPSTGTHNGGSGIVVIRNARG